MGKEREVEGWLWSGVPETARGVRVSAWDKGNKARGTARETGGRQREAFFRARVRESWLGE